MRGKRLLPALLSAMLLCLLLPAAALAAVDVSAPEALYVQGEKFELLGENLYTDAYERGTRYVFAMREGDVYYALGLEGGGLGTVSLSERDDGSLTTDENLAALSPKMEDGLGDIFSLNYLRLVDGRYLTIDASEQLTLTDSADEACRWMLNDDNDLRKLRACFEADDWTVLRFLVSELVEEPVPIHFRTGESGTHFFVYQKPCAHDNKEDWSGDDAGCLNEGRIPCAYCPDCGSWLDTAGERTIELDGYRRPYQDGDFCIMPLGHRYEAGVCVRCGQKALKYEPVTSAEMLIPEAGYRYILVNGAGGVLGIDHRGPYLETAVTGAVIEADGSLFLDSSADPDGVHAAEFCISEYVIEDAGATWPEDGTALYSALTDDYYSFIAYGGFSLCYDDSRMGTEMKYPFSIKTEESGFTAIRSWNYGEWGKPIAFGPPEYAPEEPDTFTLGPASNVKLYRSALPVLRDYPTGTEKTGTYLIPGDTKPREYKAECFNYAPTCVKYGSRFWLDNGEHTSCLWHYEGDYGDFWFAGYYDDGSFGGVVGTYNWSESDGEYFEFFTGEDVTDWIELNRVRPLGHYFDASGVCIRCGAEAALYTRVTDQSEIRADGTRYTIVGELDDTLKFLSFALDGAGLVQPVTDAEGGLWACGDEAPDPNFSYAPLEFTLEDMGDGLFGIRTLFTYDDRWGTEQHAVPNWECFVEWPAAVYNGRLQFLLNGDGTLSVLREIDAGEYENEEDLAILIHENELKYGQAAGGFFVGPEFFRTTNYGEDVTAEGKVYLYAAEPEAHEHIPGEPLRRNETEPTCTEQGSYDEVVKCTICGTELMIERKTIPPIGHVPGEPVNENETEPTCTEDGGFDRFVYCGTCGELISREHIIVDALGHDWSEWRVTTEATEETEGVETRWCSRCPETETRRIPPIGAVNDAESYVQNVYEVVLGRTEVDAEGVAHWTEQLNNGASAGVIVSEFFRSEEYQAQGHSDEETVTLCYRAMLGRDPEDAEIANWTAMLRDGYSTTKLVSEFVMSPEFQGICETYGLTAGTIALDARDQNGNITRFVERCYALALDRDADEAGLNEWAEHLLTKDLDPERVAFGFVFSDEAKGRGLDDTAFITMLYRMMLDREPDESGLANWVNALRQNTAAEIAYDAAFETGRSEADAIDQTRQNLYATFAASEEFGLMIANFGF